MDTVQCRKDKAMKNFRGGDKKAGIEVELADKIYAHLEAGKPARTCPVTDEEKEVLGRLVPADDQAGHLRGKHRRRRPR